MTPFLSLRIIKLFLYRLVPATCGLFSLLFCFDLSHSKRCPYIIYDIVGIDEVTADSVVEFVDKLLLVVCSHGKEFAGVAVNVDRLPGVEDAHASLHRFFDLIECAEVIHLLLEAIFTGIVWFIDREVIQPDALYDLAVPPRNKGSEFMGAETVYDHHPHIGVDLADIAAQEDNLAGTPFEQRVAHIIDILAIYVCPVALYSR